MPPARSTKPAGHDAEEDAAQLRAELDELRERERMYRLSAELSGRLAWSADPDGRLIAMSRIFGQLVGVEDSEWLKRNWLDFVHDEDRARFRDEWFRAFASGHPFELRCRVRYRDGRVRMVRTRGEPRRNKEGEITRWYGSAEDIQEEWAAEQARDEAIERLRQSEEMHRTTVELSRQIVWTTEADGTGLHLSNRYLEITGMDPAQEPSFSIHPDDRERIEHGWAEAVEKGEPWTDECRLITRNGGYRHFLVRAAPKRDANGRITRWYGVSEDVHEERIAETARREVEERYRLAVQATNDAVWDYDIVNGTIDWSENTAGIFGTGPAPLGRTSIQWWEERIHPEDRSEVVRSLGDAIEQGQSRWSGTYRFLRDDGRYADMLDRGFIIRDDGGEAVRAVGAMADLTDRNRAEAEIRRMQAELIHVSRLSAMGTMASTLAHELNQPLTAIANFIRGAHRLARRANADPGAIVEALDAAEAGALRAGEIVRRIRELVAHKSVSVQAEHLPTLIEEAAVLAFVDEELLGIRHRLEIDPAAEWVRADRIQIQQVLINLVRNGVEAMATSAEREITISTHGAGGMVEISVTDTGSGIEPELLGRLFSQFMTTKSGGMGIGLPICRTIVEAHGGRISAENRPEGGAVFRFTLPRAKAPRPS